MTRHTTGLSTTSATQRAAAKVQKTAPGGISCADLISRIAAGDAAAMHVFYTRHYDNVYRLAYRILRGKDAAEDITGDVFLEVWRNAGRFERQSEVSTWLFAVARNKSIDALRRSVTDTLDEDAMLLIKDEADDPDTLIRNQQRDSVLRKCLKHLSPAQRAVVELVYFHDQTTGEAARIAGIAHGTVKTRLFYAREQLMQLLGAQGIATAAA